MVITLDTGILQATLAEGTPPIKAGSQIPVTIVCVANGDPTVFAGTPTLFLGLTSSVGNSPSTLASLYSFTAGANSIFTGTLNGADPRLTTFFGPGEKAQQDLFLEVSYTVNGGLPYVAPNVIITCQQQQNPGLDALTGILTYDTATGVPTDIILFNGQLGTEQTGGASPNVLIDTATNQPMQLIVTNGALGVIQAASSQGAVNQIPIVDLMSRVVYNVIVTNGQVGFR